MKKFLIIIAILFVSAFLMANAATVSHTANQITGGVFAAGEYVFNALKITGSLNMTGNKITGLGAPTEDGDAATKEYADAASGGVIFEGYTSSTYNGSMGGTKGMMEKCNASYEGSHPCTYDETIKLGPDYPYSYDAWIIDGSYTTFYQVGPAIAQITKDGRRLITTAGNVPMCYGWIWAATNVYGPVSDTAGYLDLAACSVKRRIPCCS